MRALAALLAAVVTALAATSASSGTLAPNVKGRFVSSGTTPTCYPGEPCDSRPAAFLRFTRSGHSTRVRIGANGRFALHLASGRYQVTVLPGGSAVSPATIRVPRVGVIHPRFVQKTTSS